jgi:ATP-dependent Clp protease ATP-binding subunit ClpC
MSVDKIVGLDEFNLTPRAKKAFKDAQKFSKDRGDSVINNLHVFYGCLHNASGLVSDFLVDNKITMNASDVEEVIAMASETHEEKFHLTPNSDPWHEEVAMAIKEANKVSDNLDQYYIGIEHVLMGVFTVSDYVLEYISLFGVDLESLKTNLEAFLSGDTTRKIQFDFPSINIDELGLDLLEKSTSSLSKFSVNLNQMALKDELPEIHGREDEIASLIQVLSKKNKRNAIILGDAGVGKTAVVEGLAQKIFNSEVPSVMLPYEIYSVDLGSMIAGTKYRGEFENKFQTLLKVAKENPHVILFFDEIHNIFGAGNTEGAVDASSMLKPLLARGEIRCIGATTTTEYQKIFEKDGAMKRRFEPIEIREPSGEETKSMIKNTIHTYEDFHKVKFKSPIIDLIIDYCSKFLPHRRFPDKAFDIVDEIGSKVKIQNLRPTDDIIEKQKDVVKKLSNEKEAQEKVKEILNDYLRTVEVHTKELSKACVTVKKQDVVDVIAKQSKISAHHIKNSNNKFEQFYQRISKEVFGQDENLKTVNDLLALAKAGLNEEGKPLASLFFVGPTSVGKTYTAKQIAKHFYGNERAFIQVNMGELQDETGVAKLIGANAGYVGFEQGGFLTNFVRNNPNSVVLFDEVEKSNPKILNLLLHLLDEGYLTDNLNRDVDFSNCVVVLTSNIGHEESEKSSMGFVSEKIPKSKSYKSSVEKKLKPELLARINEVIVFNDLEDTDFKNIIKKELSTLSDKFRHKNIKLNINNNCVQFLLNKIKLKKLHARSIKDAVKQEVTIPCAKFIIENPKKREILIKVVDKQLVIN